MGWIGFKEWAYEYLWPLYPKGVAPGKLAELAIERGGINSKSKNPLFSLQTTARRWTRLGDRNNDSRFEQRYEDGVLVIYAYPRGTRIARAATTASAHKVERAVHNGFDADRLADVLVESGEFTHRLDALRAFANLTIRGVSLPETLMADLAQISKEEQELQERKKALIDDLCSVLRAEGDARP